MDFSTAKESLSVIAGTVLTTSLGGKLLLSVPSSFQREALWDQETSQGGRSGSDGLD